MAVHALLQIVHRFLRDPLRQVPGFDAVGSPFCEDKLHDRFAPSRGRGGRAFIVRVTTASDQGRISQASRRLVESTSSGRGGSDVAVAIERDRPDGVMWNSR